MVVLLAWAQATAGRVAVLRAYLRVWGVVVGGGVITEGRRGLQIRRNPMEIGRLSSRSVACFSEG
jgi:hypothetical protein